MYMYVNWKPQIKVALKIHNFNIVQILYIYFHYLFVSLQNGPSLQFNGNKSRVMEQDENINELMKNMF